MCVLGDGKFWLLGYWKLLLARSGPSRAARTHVTQCMLLFKDTFVGVKRDLTQDILTTVARGLLVSESCHTLIRARLAPRSKTDIIVH